MVTEMTRAPVVAFELVAEPSETELLAEMVCQGLEGIARVQARGAEELGQAHRPLDAADFRTAALGAFVELGELVNECQWKTWRSYAPPTEEECEKVVKEFGDVLHFLAWMANNLRHRFGLTPYDLAEGFMRVHEENVARFRGQVPGREPPRSP